MYYNTVLLLIAVLTNVVGTTYAWMLQVLFSFVTVNAIKSFLIWLSVYVLITVVLCLLLFFLNKNFEKKYYDLRAKLDKENPDRHSDYHTITEF